MKILKHKESGNLYEETPDHDGRCGKDEICVCPQGGGFAGVVKRDDLEEVEMPTDVVIGWATIDCDEYAYRCTYNPDHRWNGWHEPIFSRAMIERITHEWDMEIVETENGTYMYNEEEHGSPDWGICLSEYDDGTWSMSGICWTCYTEEEFKDTFDEGELTRVMGDEPLPRKPTKAVFELQAYEETKEDRGKCRTLDLSDERENGVYVRMISWDDDKNHEEWEKLDLQEGRKYKVTIEEIAE
jgi:hypothetical protein